MIADMRLEVTRDVTMITSMLQPLLEADPVRNTVLSSVVAGLHAPDADGWCAYPADQPDVLAVRSMLHTPIVVTAGWIDIGPLADTLAGLASLTAIGGPVPVMDRLVAALGERGIVIGSRVAERLFRLDELSEGSPAAGGHRLASRDDLARLADWYEAFLLDAFGRLPPGFDGAAAAERGLTRSRVWLRTDDVDGPVSMAVRQPTSFGVSRIGPVYTPRHLRGRGYGSSATAAATRDVLADNAVPVLYTDLANPTSNKIYQRLGYYPVEDRSHVELG